MDYRDFNILIDNLTQKILYDIRYYKFYYSEVKLAADLEFKGHVMVACDQLGATKPFEWIRAMPVSGGRSYIAPKRGDKGMLFFQDADALQARFLAFPQSSFLDKLPTQKKSTLVETPTMGSKIDVDELVGGFTIHSKSPLGSISSPEPTVLGDKLKDLWDFQMEMNNTILTMLNTILGYMMTHIHGTGVGPSSPAMPPTPVNVAKDKVKVSAEQVKITAKKSQYAIPGQLLSPSNKMN